MCDDRRERLRWYTLLDGPTVETVDDNDTSPVIGEKARYWSRVATFAYPPALAPPIWAGFPSVRVYCHEVWYGKTRMEWLPDSAQNLKIWLLVLTEYMKVTDRRTDRQADRRIDRHHHDGIGRAYAWHWPDHHWQRHGRLRACVRTKSGHFEQLFWQYSVSV